MRRAILLLAVLLALALLATYVYVYQVSPFTDEVNQFILELADPLVTLLAAVTVTAVFLQYRREDGPYKVWLYLTLGLWVWVLAEGLWSYIDFTTGEAPPIGIPDVFWIGGYAILTLALRNQYQLVYTTPIAWWKMVAVWAGIVITDAVSLLVFRSEFTLENFVNYLYPVIDFALAIAAFRLFMAFGGGKLSRPWIGLFVMGISDLIWAWLNAIGQYQTDTSMGAWLSVFTDSSYVAAYLILCLGFLMQYLLLRFGPGD